MHRLASSLVILLIIIAVTPLDAIGGYEDVGIGTKESIPQNLPWYFITVFGDNRPDESGEVEYNPIFYRIVDEMDFINPFAVIGVGDHVWNGYIDQIQHFIETVEDLPNVWVVAGNHEWNNEPTETSRNYEGVMYWRQHVAPDLYYKDDIPGWRIVFINLRAGYPVDEKWSSVENWLVNQAFNTSRNLIVVFHEPVKPIREASKAIREVQDELIPLLNQYRPKIVLQGHKHCYYDGSYGGTMYIITGGGGAPKCHSKPFHFVVVYLKPSGVYKVLPIDAETFSYDIERSSSGGRVSVIVTVNNVEDVYGNNLMYIPFRTSITIDGVEYTVLTHLHKGLNNITAVDLGDHVEFIIKTYHKLGYNTTIYTSRGEVYVSNTVGYNELAVIIDKRGGYITTTKLSSTEATVPQTTLSSTPKTTVTITKTSNTLNTYISKTSTKTESQTSRSMPSTSFSSSITETYSSLEKSNASNTSGISNIDTSVYVLIGLMLLIAVLSIILSKRS